MAKYLWLLRHGEAVPHGARPDDGARELTPKGEGQSTAAGRGLAHLGVEFEACYTSPKLRARDTARLAAAELGVAVAEVESLADGLDVSDVHDLLAAHDGNVLVVGHEPDFSQVVHDLTGALVDFKKGGVAAVKMGSSPALIVLLRPAELVAMGG
jgi:phosphohistidine phosphatase